MDHIVDEQEILAEAQATLLRRRSELAERPREPVLLRRAGSQVLVRYGAGQCLACGTSVPHVGICNSCAREVAWREQQDAIHTAIEREIPERFRWVRWNAPKLRGRVAGGEHKVSAARAVLGSDAPVVVLLGPGRAGKSSLAAAWLRAELEAGRLGSRWVAARSLGDEEAPEGRALPYARALTAEQLVLDDLGAELAGAPEQSGLLGQRAEPAIRLISERYDRNGGRLVITTAIGYRERDTDLRRALAAYYGDGVAGRVYEHAAVVRVGGGQ